jgi:hypothetical protein
MISYQGVISDSLGMPLPDGEHVFSYSLFDDSTGGNQLWSEQHTVLLRRGLFSVILGSVNPFPDSMRFDKAYWLEIACDRCGPMNPRLQMTAVGYSLNAARSDTALYAFNTPVGFADSARIAGTLPDGSLTSEKFGDGQIVRSVNQLKDNVVLTAEGGATITSSGDTITIHAGTGSSDSTGIFGIQNTNNTLDILNPNGPTTTVNVKNAGIGASQLADNAVTSAKIQNGTISFADIGQNGAGNGEVMKWTGSAWAAGADNVGTNTSGWTDHGSYIGLTTATDSVRLNTNSTLGKLAVNGSIGLIGQRSIFFDTENTYLTKLSTGDLRIGAMDGQLRLLGEDLSVLTTGSITFGHYGDESWAAFDNANKRFGIGTLSPVDRLTVANAEASACWLRIQGTNATNWGQTGLRIQTPANTWHLRQDLYTHANFPEGALSLYSGGGTTEAMTWLEDGKVGIGTTNPSKKLHVNGSAQVRDTLFTNVLEATTVTTMPGLAHSIAGTGVVSTPLATSWGVMNSVTLNIPAPGYVLIFLTYRLQSDHTLGDQTNVSIGISGKSDGTEITELPGWYISTLRGTTWETEHFAVQQPVHVTTGGSHTFFLMGYREGGSGKDLVYWDRCYMTALYFPVAYGTVE